MPTQLTLKRSRPAVASPKVLKRTKSKANTNVSRSIVSVGRTFPKKLRTVLRYVERNTLTPTAGSYSELFFKCNGLYDPTDAIGGHQPYGFDQYAAIYNHYHVYKSVATVQFSYVGSSNSGAVVGLNITPGATDSDTPATKMEKQDGRKNYKLVALGYPVHTITKTWTDKAYFGLQKNEQDMSAAVTADPVELSHFCLWASNIDTTATQSIVALLTVEYYVEFIEPKSLGGS